MAARRLALRLGEQRHRHQDHAAHLGLPGERKLGREHRTAAQPQHGDGSDSHAVEEIPEGRGVVRHRRPRAGAVGLPESRQVRRVHGAILAGEG